MIVGALRGCLGLIFAPIFSVVLGIAVGKEFGGWWGCVATLITLVFLCQLVAKMANSAQGVTPLDCFVPLLMSIAAAVVFAPFKLIANGAIFSPVTCVGAGLLLCIGLFLFKHKRMKEWALILPFFTFLYEMLPVSLPTDLDDLLALGGATTLLFAGYIKRIVSGDDEKKVERRRIPSRKKGTKCLTTGRKKVVDVEDAVCVDAEDGES